MRKMCIFCGHRPVDKNKEHVIPQWLIRATGRTGAPIVDGPDKKIGFMSFTMPACTACNDRYSKLELATKGVMEKIFAGAPVNATEMDTLLDWFDKVRVGLWLANAYLNPKMYDFQPKIAIDTRVGKLDRALVVEKIDMPASDKGILIEGLYSPIFIYSPSVFQMLINNYSFTSASSINLVSPRLGFPMLTNVAVVPSGRTSANIQSTREKILRPVIKEFEPNRNQIVFYQPMFTQYQSLPQFDTKYVREHSLDFASGRGGIFYSRGNHTTVNYMSPTDSVRINPPMYPNNDQELNGIYRRMYEMQVSVNNMPIKFDTGDKNVDAELAMLRREKSDFVSNFVKDKLNGR